MTNFLKYGLMAGILYAVYALALQLTGSDLRFNTTLSFSIILILPIIFMVMAVKSDRNLQEGLISFGEALKTSFLTYLVFIIIAVAVGQLMITMYSEDDWNKLLEIQQGMVTSMFNAVGMDQLQIDEELDKITMESIKEKTSGVGVMLVGVVMWAFVGLIKSLIISAIMKKNPTP